MYSNPEPTTYLTDFFTCRTDFALYFSKGTWQHLNSKSEELKEEGFKNVLEAKKPTMAEVKIL